MLTQDLLDGTEFNGKKDIITIQDPHDFTKRNIGNFFHVREGTGRESSEATKATVRLDPTARRILHSVCCQPRSLNVAPPLRVLRCVG